MQSLALSLIIAGAALAQGPHPQGVKHVVLDMNVEAVSLLGQKLYRTPAEGEELKKLEATLAEAEKHVAAQPDSPAVYLELAKAHEGLWRYHDAAQAYTKVIALSPDDPDAYAHRGNMFVLLRLFDQAKNDFEHATAKAPQTPSHKLGLGLANYLRHKFEEADKAYVEALALALTDDEKEIAGFMRNLTQRRLGKPADPTAPNWESMSAYAAGLDKLLAGDQAGALAAWHKIADDLTRWPMLPNIMAESEIAALEGLKKMKPLNEE